MKKKLFLALPVLAVICIFVSQAYADITVIPMSSQHPLSQTPGHMVTTNSVYPTGMSTGDIMHPRAVAAVIQTERAAYQAKLQALKDVKKQAVVARINTSLITVNQQVTTHLSSSLDRLNGVLGTISTQVHALKTAGRDTASADAAITTAQQAIATAKASVTTQATNNYIIQLTDDAAVKTDVTVTVTQLKTDLTGVYQSVFSARSAVLTAAQELGKLSNAVQHSATTSATVQ